MRQKDFTLCATSHFNYRDRPWALLVCRTAQVSAPRSTARSTDPHAQLWGRMDTWWTQCCCGLRGGDSGPAADLECLD
jgi:hypothetical protein